MLQTEGRKTCLWRARYPRHQRCSTTVAASRVVIHAREVLYGPAHDHFLLESCTQIAHLVNAPSACLMPEVLPTHNLSLVNAPETAYSSSARPSDHGKPNANPGFLEIANSAQVFWLTFAMPTALATRSLPQCITCAL